MDSKTTSLKQPWQEWYKPSATPIVDLRSVPKSLRGRAQGSLPQKSRNVNFAIDTPVTERVELVKST